MKKSLFILLIITFAFRAHTQPYMLKGQVVGSIDDRPLRNATVIGVGEKVATSTDESGFFSLYFSRPEFNIRISHIGYETFIISGRLPNEESLLVKMDPESKRLGEVVVSTGYEKLPLERATGSFEHIDNNLINRSVGVDVLGRLENLTAGLFFNKTTNDFNSVGQKPSHDLYIHGISTLRDGAIGANSPLIVLDNFPYFGDVNNINPNDIESVTILKDAAATSIWGAKAGNGVIVITSKAAAYEQPLTLSFNTNTNVFMKPNLRQRPVIGVSDYIDVEMFLFEQGFYSNQENDPARPALSPVVELLIKQRDGQLNEHEAMAAINEYRKGDVRKDMLRHIYRQAVQQQYSLQVTGGNQKHKFLISGGYDKSHATQRGSDFSRLSLRAENSLKVADRFEIVLGARFVQNHVNDIDPAEGYTDFGYRFPYVSFTGADGQPVPVPRDYRLGFLDTAGAGKLLDWHYWPLAAIDNPPISNRSQELMLDLGMSYQLASWLTFDVKYQYATQRNMNQQHNNIDSYYTRNLINRGSEISSNGVFYHVPFGGILSRSRGTSVGYDGRGQFNVNRNWNDVHALHGLVGLDVQHRHSESDGFMSYGYREDLLTQSKQIDFTSRYPVYGNLGSTEALTYPVMDFTDLTQRFVSVFANASYTYDSRYMASVSGRRDASNLFGVSTNNKWKPLWSAGVGWSVNNEPYYQLDWLPKLKVRATWGYSGNVDNSMSALTTIAYTNQAYTGVDWPGAMLRNPPNPSLRWEIVRTSNLGVDFSLFNNRIYGTLDVYWKQTDDLLHNFPIDPTVGVSSMVMNVANTKSRGVDINLNALHQFGTLKWSSHVLLTYNNNWITKSFTPYVRPTSFVRGDVMSAVEGTMVFPIYSYRWAGLDPSTGEPRGYLNGEISKDYRNITSSGTTLDDLVLHGSGRPLWFGSIRNDFIFNNVSLSFNIAGSFAYFFRRSGMDYARLLNNGDGHRDYKLRWQQPGDEIHTHVPAFEYPVSQGNGFYQYVEPLVEPGDHIRLSDIRVGYSITRSNRYLRDLQVYFYAQNIGIIWRANKVNLDPQAGGNIPTPRSFAVGLNFHL